MNRKRIWSILAMVIVLAGLLAFAGCAGDDGAVGPAGLRGLQGEQGAQGDTGSRGATGSQGEQGIAGTDGAQGATGEQGIRGLVGADGTDGATGDTGPRGSSGSGSRGSTGATGATGAVGSTGADGYPYPPVMLPSLSESRYGTGATIATTGMDSTEAFTGLWSVRLATGAERGAGDTATIVLTPVGAMTLGDITSISWMEYSISGYPPHADIMLDLDNSGTWTTPDDALVFEYAYNGEVHALAGGPDYGASHDGWYATFSDDLDGPVAITDTANAWATQGAPGPLGGSDPDFIYHTLGDWKAGQTYTLGTTERTINTASAVLRIEIEVDNWIAGSDVDALVDDIYVNGQLVHWVP